MSNPDTNDVQKTVSYVMAALAATAAVTGAVAASVPIMAGAATLAAVSALARVRISKRTTPKESHKNKEVVAAA